MTGQDTFENIDPAVTVEEATPKRADRLGGGRTGDEELTALATP